ncbi:MAG: DegT/DnrJ/EryC1/StrS family aminotransferase [Treponema sp.]|jgi:dTDP-4-amino-4,6-dideoxygalactose transaminase|nr:DegT/DnrJ/EryC1/StrS family aminotransferase [Treponema sp.]
MKIEVYSPTVRRKEMDAVLTAMVEDSLGPGEHTQFLVHTAKEHFAFDYCLALRTPAFALQLALETLKAGASGDGNAQGVIISALAPLYYDRVIRSLGLLPLYCDTGEDTPLAAEQKIEVLMGSRPLCAVITHSLGYMPSPDLAAELGVPVIEDASQSFGALWGEKKAGTAGNFTILGLEERDMITAGGGALLFAMNRKDAALLRGMGELPPEFLLPGVNAAMAAVQFRESGKNLLKRRELAQAYTQASLQTRHKRFSQAEGLDYNNYAFPLVIESGVKDIKAYARRKEIIVEEAFESSLVGSGLIPAVQCPCAASLALRTLLFPLYPRLSAAQAGEVAKLIATLP